MTLTNLIPIIHESLDLISREQVGFIPSVAINASSEKAALNQTIRIPVVPAAGASADNTPAQYAPGTGASTIGYTDMTISKSVHQPVLWTGEEELSVNQIYAKVLRDQFMQAFRKLVNDMEIDLATVAYKAASRAYGTAATNPFASSIANVAQIRKILDDNGCPPGDRALIIDTVAGAQLRSLAILNNANTAGTDSIQRTGELLNIFGIAIRESAQVQTHTKGTATGMDCTAIEPVGETTIAVDGSNSGTILAGDVITRGVEGGSAADTNKYVVASATASGAASGNITINKPGVKLATAVTDEWTIGNDYTANVAFQRNALQLITRVPQTPSQGDMAADKYLVTDDFSGITFEIALYPQYLQNHIQVRIAYGYAAIKSEHIAVLLG